MYKLKKQRINYENNDKHFWRSINRNWYMMMAGSAGDCDGKCMESANTLTEMLMYSLMGLAVMLVGGFITIKSN